MKVFILHGHVVESAAFFFWVSSDVAYFMSCNSVCVVSKYMNYTPNSNFYMFFSYHCPFIMFYNYAQAALLKFDQCCFLPMK